MPSSKMIIIATLVAFTHICGILAQAIEPEHVWCGTSTNANLADCEILLNDDDVWNEKFTRWSHLHTYDDTWDMRVACNGACCVFLKQGPGTDCAFTDTRRRALSLLRCANTEAGLVNGLAMFAEDGDTPRQGICLANMNGIDDCFTGDDFLDAIGE